MHQSNLLANAPAGEKPNEGDSESDSDTESGVPINTYRKRLNERYGYNVGRRNVAIYEPIVVRYTENIHRFTQGETVPPIHVRGAQDYAKNHPNQTHQASSWFNPVTSSDQPGNPQNTADYIFGLIFGNPYVRSGKHAYPELAMTPAYAEPLPEVDYTRGPASTGPVDPVPVEMLQRWQL